MIIIIVCACILFVGIVVAATSYARLEKYYKKYSEYQASIGLNALEFISLSIKNLGLKSKISLTDKHLGDAYSVSKDVIVLSKEVAEDNSVSAIAVSSHELGHAIQNKNRSFWLRLSSFFRTLNKLAGFLLFPSLVSGIILLFVENAYDAGLLLLQLSLLLWAITYILKIVTIPLEFNASKIAFNFLKEYRVLKGKELRWAKKLLHTAGLTYIGSLFSTPYNIIRTIYYLLKK